MQLHLSIEGNLAGDPTIDHLDDGTPVCHFRVLHTRRTRVDGQWRDGAVTGVDVTCWGPLAERAAESLNRGDTVIVTGTDPKAQAWVSRDGESRASLELTADTVSLSLRFHEATSHRRREAATV